MGEKKYTLKDVTTARRDGYIAGCIQGRMDLAAELQRVLSLDEAVKRAVEAYMTARQP